MNYRFWLHELIEHESAGPALGTQALRDCIQSGLPAVESYLLEYVADSYFLLHHQRRSNEVLHTYRLRVPDKAFGKKALPVVRASIDGQQGWPVVTRQQTVHGQCGPPRTPLPPQKGVRFGVRE